MTRAPLLALLPCLWTTNACQAGDVANTEHPAVIAAPDAEVHRLLENAVSQALGGMQVILGNDALTRSDVLVLDRNTHRTLAGAVNSGRSREMPEKFHLILTPAGCVLIRDKTGERLPLVNIRCKPAGP